MLTETQQLERRIKALEESVVRGADMIEAMGRRDIADLLLQIAHIDRADPSDTRRDPKESNDG